MSKSITWNSSNVGVSSRWTRAKSRGTTAKAVRKASERSGKYKGGWLARVEKETSELCTKMGNSPINRQLLPEIEVYRGPLISGKAHCGIFGKVQRNPRTPTPLRFKHIRISSYPNFSFYIFAHTHICTCKRNDPR